MYHIELWSVDYNDYVFNQESLLQCYSDKEVRLDGK